MEHSLVVCLGREHHITFTDFNELTHSPIIPQDLIVIFQEDLGTTLFILPFIFLKVQFSETLYGVALSIVLANKLAKSKAFCRYE